MGDSMLLGISRFMMPIPRMIWHGQMPGKARQLTKDMSFMTEQHHKVRNYTVRELPRSGKLSPKTIADGVSLPVNQVNDILDDLVAHHVYAFRDGLGYVTWAYPSTVDITPHHVALSNGEEIYAA